MVGHAEHERLDRRLRKFLSGPPDTLEGLQCPTGLFGEILRYGG
jgi:hypothetical protein